MVVFSPEDRNTQIVLKNGTVSEQGTYAQLMAEHGELFRLIEEFSKGEEEEDDDDDDVRARQTPVSSRSLFFESSVYVVVNADVRVQ